MRAKSLNTLAWVVLLGMICPAATADVITLTDGSRLVGKLDDLGGGQARITTDFAGQLVIDAAKVQSIATEDTVVVGLSTGDRLVGSAETNPDGAGMVVHTAMGTIPVEVGQIEAVWQTDGKSPEVVAMETLMEEERKVAEGKIGKWSATLELGAQQREGNIETLDAHARIEAVHKSDSDLLRLYLSGDYGEENKKRNTAEVKGGAYLEHLFTDRLFGYTRSEAEYDEFENLDLRFTAALGAGYYWIKEEKHELKTRAGVGYLHESYLDGTSRDDAMMDVGLDYRVDLFDWLQLVHSTTYYPTFESMRDYRVVADSGLLIPLGDGDVWKLKLGALLEYDSIPPDGVDSLDRMYYGSVVFTLK
ncbi:MAG: DUF481 domain-containing protein [bacterium]|nr:DUF481 domain-containing protein [bacterium]